MPGQQGAGCAEFGDDVFVCHEAEFYAPAGGSASVQLAVSNGKLAENACFRPALFLTCRRDATASDAHLASRAVTLDGWFADAPECGLPDPLHRHPAGADASAPVVWNQVAAILPLPASLDWF